MNAIEPYNQHQENTLTDIADKRPTENLNDAFVYALEPYTAKQILASFEGFIPDHFVNDSKAIGIKGKNGVAKRTKFTLEIIDTIDRYTNSKLDEFCQTNNKHINEEIKALVREYIHHHILTYKAFHQKSFDMILEKFVSPLLTIDGKSSSEKTTKKAIDKKNPEIECFYSAIDIPVILKNELSVEKINETIDAKSIAQDVLFPILKYIMYPKCPFQLRKAMVWKQRVTRIMNFTICSVLILKYKNHNELNKSFKKQLAKYKLPPWWFVSCFFNTYKLSESKIKDKSSIPKETISVNRTMEWEQFQKTLELEYKQIHAELYNIGASYWNTVTFDHKKGTSTMPKNDGFQDLKMNYNMNRPSTFQNVPEFIYKYKKYYLKGIFDEGWLEENNKDSSPNIVTPNNNLNIKKSSTSIKCKNLFPRPTDGQFMQSLSTTDLRFVYPLNYSQVKSFIKEAETSTSDDTATGNTLNEEQQINSLKEMQQFKMNDHHEEADGNTLNEEEQNVHHKVADQWLEEAGKEGVHLYEHLILDKVFAARMFDISVANKRFARGC